MVIVGEGPGVFSLWHYAAAGLSDRVHFAGAAMFLS